MKREAKRLSVLFVLGMLVALFSGCNTIMQIIGKTEKNTNVELTYNQYGPNYQGYGPAIDEGFELTKGRNIKISISGVSDTDLSELQVFIVDPSEAASWWLEITSSTAFVLNDIKAGEKFEESTVLKIINEPVSRKDTKICFSTVSAKKTVKLSDVSITISDTEDVAKIEKVEDKDGTASIADISSINLVKEMKAGWNLGNTLDAFISGGSGLASETCWGNPRTTQQIVHMGTANGYKTIRIPVTWFNHIVDENYTIDPAWMKRVKTIVDWAIGDGYYVILNEHHSVHDNMNSPLEYGDGYIVRNTKKDIAESEAFLKAVWTQVAAAFNTSYDEHLIFETMNEPRNTGHNHCWYPDSMTASCAECKADFEILNKYNQICLDAIRASGGPNANRFVLIPSLCTGDTTPNNNFFKFPEDSATDRLILTVHNYIMGAGADYVKTSFEDSMKTKIDNMFVNLNTNFISKGIPVVVGETGAFSQVISAEERIKWISYFAGKANEYGASVVYWDDGGDFRVFDRRNCKPVSGNEEFVQAFADAFN